MTNYNIYAEDRTKDKIISLVHDEEEEKIDEIFNVKTFNSQKDKAVEFQPNDSNSEKQLLYIQFTEDTEKLINKYIAIKSLSTNKKKIKEINKAVTITKNDQLKKDSINHIFSKVNNFTYFQRIFPSAIFRNRAIIKIRNLKDLSFSYNQNFISIRYEFDAIYDSQEKKLYFYKFSTISKFLNVSDFYRKATKADLETFSKHEIISLSDKILNHGSEASMRKIAYIIDKNKLDNYKIDEIKNIIKDYNITLKVDKGKVILKTATDINNFYKVINTQFYTDPITGDKRIVDSYRSVINELENKL